MALRIGFLADPQALYRLEEWYHTQDCEVLFGPGVSADAFSDDALGRALLKLHAADPPKLFAELRVQAWGSMISPARMPGTQTRRR